MKKVIMFMVAIMAAGLVFASGTDHKGSSTEKKGSGGQKDPAVQKVMLEYIESVTNKESGLIKLGLVEAKFDYLHDGIKVFFKPFKNRGSIKFPFLWIVWISFSVINKSKRGIF